MDVTSICLAFENAAFSKAIIGPTWLWPSIESIHMIAMATLVASISTFDLRLLGVALRDVPVSKVGARLIPATWAAFGVMIVTGVLLFLPLANRKYCPNTSFRVKLVLMALAGINMTVFHLTSYIHVSEWERGQTPLAAKIVGTLSVLLWAGVVIAGRLIGFV